jgi:hypothetical protein
MTEEAQREAAELASLLGNLHPAYGTLVARSDFRAGLTKVADKLLKEVDGQTKADLETAKRSIEAVTP